MFRNDFQDFEIETYVLKVQINCDGCKRRVKKLLNKTKGVYQVKIDMEEQKVTISGAIDCASLIKKLQKLGKHAEMWSPKPNNDDHTWINDDQTQSFINGLDASKNQPILSPTRNNLFDQWGPQIHPDQRSGVGYLKGVTEHSFRGPTSSGFEGEQFSGLQKFYCPPVMIRSNMHNQQYNFPPTMTMHNDVHTYRDDMTYMPQHHTMYNDVHTFDNMVYMPPHQIMMYPMVETYPYPYMACPCHCINPNHWNTPRFNY